jgi:hypothetical protein
VSKANDQNQDEDEMTSQPAEFMDAVPGTTGIPKFDLAEQIMAEQRKIAATRRKGPGKKVDVAKQERDGPITLAVEPFSTSSEELKIIAEIVARDIQQLCKPSGWSMESGIGGRN